MRMCLLFILMILTFIMNHVCELMMWMIVGFWHGRLEHASMKTLSKLVINDLAIGLPKLIFDKDKNLWTCQFGKQVRSSFKSKNLVTTSRPLELLHIDLFGSMNVISMDDKSYGFVITDYSRFT